MLAIEVSKEVIQPDMISYIMMYGFERHSYTVFAIILDNMLQQVASTRNRNEV